MQTLSPQYTTILTRKFRVYYSDFAGISTSFYRADICTLGKHVEVLGVKVWHREAFVASPMSTCLAYVIYKTFPLESNIQQRSLCNWNAMEPVEIYSGALKFQQPLIQQPASPVQQFIANQTADTTVCVGLVRTGATGNPAFTAGYFDIWIITANMP